MSPEKVPLRSCHIGTVKSHVALVPQLFVFELIWFPEDGSLRFSSDITNTVENRAKGISLRPPDRVMNICILCCNRSPCERDPLLADEDLGKKVPCMAWLASKPPPPMGHILLLPPHTLSTIESEQKPNCTLPTWYTWHLTKFSIDLMASTQSLPPFPPHTLSTISSQQKTWLHRCPIPDLLGYPPP